LIATERNMIKLETIIIEEQGLRDGIQNIDQVIPTDFKLKLIDRLVASGIKRIQVASFVHPKLVPQMADAEEICKKINKKAGVIYSGLVLNTRGVERGVAAGLNHLSCSISASDTHSQKNARMTLPEAMLSFSDMVKLCNQSGVTTRGGIQCAFGCRYEGKIDQQHVLDMVKHHLDSGIDELALADSTGMANPLQLDKLMRQVVELANGIPVILHLHNTENKGFANVYAALRAGVKIFDTAFGGLGGCPFIKSATGNIATEDTVHMLHQMGFETGIDLSAVVNIAKDMADHLGYELPGKMYTLINNADIKII
jgi:hydroxymethylglutaryl-CoA lyase